MAEFKNSLTMYFIYNLYRNKITNKTLNKLI